MKNKFAGVIVVCLFAAGCTSKLVRMPGSKMASEYAPVNEKSLPGVVRYLNEGMQSIRDSRRKSAYKKMYDVCDGHYKIVEEKSETDGGVISPIGGMAAYSSSKYQFIYFECTD